MTQIALGISVGIINSTKGDCWFCKEKPKSKDLKNDEVADPDTSNSESEDAVPENDIKNNASKLGKHLGNKPTWTITCPDQEKNTTVLSAAHHCIPGNASFKNATDLLDFVRKNGPFKLASDIGYSINHENNGVWLAGNYNVRANKGGYKKTWGSYNDNFKNEYARRAIDASNSNFHDAHSEYNDLVLETLQDLSNKIDEPEGKCPFCGEDYDSKRPPFGLVGRLDFVSREHKKMITNMSSNKSRKVHYINAGYFTSSRVKNYFRKIDGK